MVFGIKNLSFLIFVILMTAGRRISIKLWERILCLGYFIRSSFSM